MFGGVISWATQDSLGEQGSEPVVTVGLASAYLGNDLNDLGSHIFSSK
mgnify:FL=1